jgi:hypothetical protein
MIKRVPSLKLLAVILFFHCFGQYVSLASAYAPTLDPEEYVVYAVIIERVFLNEKPMLFVIADRTLKGSVTIDDSILHFKAQLQPLTQDTMEDFDQKNHKSEQIGRQIKTRHKYIVISEKGTREYFGEGRGSWEAFDKKYPHSKGLVALSRVGFNIGKNQALVYVSHSCGRRCGTGKYYVLTKDRRGWRIRSEFLFFQS